MRTRLQEVLARQRQLVAMITAEMQRFAKTDSKVKQRSHRAVLRNFQRDQIRIYGAIERLIEETPSWWATA